MVFSNHVALQNVGYVTEKRTVEGYLFYELLENFSVPIDEAARFSTMASSLNNLCNTMEDATEEDTVIFWKETFRDPPWYFHYQPLLRLSLSISTHHYSVHDAPCIIYERV